MNNKISCVKTVELYSSVIVFYSQESKRTYEEVKTMTENNLKGKLTYLTSILTWIFACFLIGALSFSTFDGHEFGYFSWHPPLMAIGVNACTHNWKAPKSKVFPKYSFLISCFVFSKSCSC